MSHDRSTHDWGFVDGMLEPEHADRPRSSPEPRADAAGREVRAFAVDGAYLLCDHFDEAAVLDALAPFYDRRRRRFEVPAAAFEGVCDLLDDHGYAVTVVEELAPLAVVVERGAHHPECVFERAVLQVSTGDHNVFVLAEEAAVDRAVAAGATRLPETPLRLRLAGDPTVGRITVADVAVR